MDLTTATASVRMAKRIEGGRTVNPAMPAKWTSQKLEVEGGKALMAAMAQAGDAGQAVVCGHYQWDLQAERRAGAADPQSLLPWACIDVDGLPVPFSVSPPLNQNDTMRAAAFLSQVLGTPLPAFAHASASHGLGENTLRIHLFHLLEPPEKARYVHDWLERLNYVPALNEALQLSDSGMTLKYVVDPSLGQVGRLLFTAPPIALEGASPYPNPKDRWAWLGGPPANVREDLVEWPPERIKEERKKRIRGLRKAAGLKAKEPKLGLRETADGPATVLENPGSVRIEVVDDSHPDYVRCNVNGGDSRGYYFLRSSPALMRNFKGEPFWPIVAADPDFAVQAANFRPKTGQGGRRRPVVFRDPSSDGLYSILLDDRTGDFAGASKEPVHRISRANVWDFLTTHGQLAKPESYPDAHLVFDPEAGAETPAFPPDTVPGRVNVWRPTAHRIGAKKLDQQPTMDDLQPFFVLAPTITRLTYHVLGGERESLARFFNWLAFIWQYGTKTQTAWVISGVFGTGKGLLGERVLKPIFGYVEVKSMQSLEEKFNSYMERTQILVVDEFRHAVSRDRDRLAERIKMEITDPELTVRAMRTDQVSRKSYLNFIFLSNHMDAVGIEPGDRRFNVAPFQDVKLREALGSELLEKVWLSDGPGSLGYELQGFASLLESFDVDRARVHVPLENAARALVQRITISSFDDLSLALREGGLEYFLPIREMVLGNVFGGDLAYAQDVVERFIADAATEKESLASSEELRRVYNLVAERDRQIGPRAFRKELAKRRVMGNSRKRVGGSYLRGVRIRWSPASMDIAAELVAGNEEKTREEA